MIRDPGYLDKMPDEIKKDFIEVTDEGIEKVSALKTCLHARFKVS